MKKTAFVAALFLLFSSQAFAEESVGNNTAPSMKTEAALASARAEAPSSGSDVAAATAEPRGAAKLKTGTVVAIGAAVAALAGVVSSNASTTSHATVHH